jgi:hypothetical protein
MVVVADIIYPDVSLLRISRLHTKFLCPSLDTMVLNRR